MALLAKGRVINVACQHAIKYLSDRLQHPDLSPSGPVRMIDVQYRIVTATDLGGDVYGQPEVWLLSGQMPEPLVGILGMPIQFKGFTVPFDQIAWDQASKTVILSSRQSPPPNKAEPFRTTLRISGFVSESPMPAPETIPPIIQTGGQA